MRSMLPLAPKAQRFTKCIGPVLAGALAMACVSHTAAAGHATAPAQRAPHVADALDGVFAAFATRPVVALSDVHGLAQEGAFYAALVRDPRFAAQVGNLVVEFGGAAHQDTVDRYVNGGDVSYADLRKVWTDVVGWERPPGQMYANLFAAVRAANADLPADRRIRIWLGEPAVDWTKISTFDDLAPYMAQRDSHPADLISAILDRGGKALVVYGGLHFFTGPDGEDAIKQLVERRHPRAVFVVTTYAGFGRAVCGATFGRRFGKGSKPVLAMPIAGTWIEAALRRRGCVDGPRFVETASPSAGESGAPAPASPPPTPSPQTLARIAEAASGVGSDALLYLGPAVGLTRTPDLQDLYLDEAYRQEILRRQRLIGLPPASPTEALDRNTRAHAAYRSE